MTKIRRLVLDAMLVALYTVLSLFAAFNLGNMRITLEAFPVLVGAMLLGPADGLLIGFFGSFLNQLLTYGFSLTTVLWILPHAASGLLVGWYARKNGFGLSRSRIVFISVLSALTVTALNTAAMWLDSVIWGYFSYAYVFGSLILRILSGIITAVIFAAVLPAVLKQIQKTFNK